MSLFRKPQEKKGSAVHADAHSGKKALKKSGGLNIPFFGGKGDEKKHVSKENQPEEAKETKAPARERFGTSSEVILRPRITEKSTDVAAYVFDVHTDANKVQIKQGIKELYGVDAVKVHIARVPQKKVRSRRGQMGVKSGGKKAYVYLKKGDTIEFV